MKINLKLILILLEVTLIPLVIVIFVSYSNAKSQISLEEVSKLVAEADIQKSRFINRIKENNDSLNLITHDPDIVQEVATYLSQPSPEAKALIQNSLMGETQLLTGFRSVSVANLKGIIFASTNPKLVGVDISGNPSFQKGKTANSATDFSKDAGGIISLNIDGPIVSNGKTIGVLAIDSNGSNITSVVTDYSGLGDTGETLLVTKDANRNAIFLTPTRFDPNSALTRVISNDKTNIPSTHAAQGEEITMLDAVDYNGTSVIGVTRYIASANWGIVAKISQSEAYAPVKNMGNLLVFMGVISALTIVVISFAIAKSFTDPIVKLTEASKKLALGDLGQRVDVTSKDEIGTLMQVFNETGAKLQASYQDLEMKVADRTHELSQNIKELEDARSASLNILEDVNTEKTKYEALLTGIADGVIATDAQTNIIVINPAAEKILGLNKDDVAGKRLGNVLVVTDSKGLPLPENERPYNMAILGMKPFSTSVESDYYYTKKDGTKIPVALNASPIIIDGKLIGVIDVFRDISHEKEVDKMKTEFVSLSSHQLRTPLTAIKWGLEAFMEEPLNLNGKQKEELNDINNSTVRMIDLVNSLLNISRIESGRIAITPTPTNIVKIANDAVGKLKMEIAKKDITLVMNIADGIPVVSLDQSLIFNVFQNLISNAVSYSPSGSKITVSIGVKDEDIISSIKDEGIGIPEQEKAKIFEKFYRTANAKKARPDGSGLGLYIVKSIVESSGGKIWFESSEGKGSTFYFSLPLTGMKAKAGEVTLT